MLLYGEWVEQNMLAPVAHRQYVFTLPKLLRPIFSRHRAWRYCDGFSAHNRVRIGDREGRMKLAGYMIRAPMSLAKMTYDPASGMVIYRSKMHLGLKRNFQVMPSAQWLELLCKHIPDRYEYLVRYVGW